MALITQNLIYQLDASVLPLSGFVNNQNLVGAFIPDQVDSKGWYGSAGYDMYLVTNAQNGKAVIRCNTGNIAFKEPGDLLKYNSLTVLIAAKRRGPSYTNTWMGLFSAWYNYSKSGLSIFAITNNANVGGFDYWGTYGGIITTASTSAMNLDTPIVVGVTSDINTAGNFYTNGINTGSFTNSKDQGYFGVGGLESAEGFFVGDIFEVLVYKSVLNGAQIQDSSAYLVNKWFP